MRSRLIYVADIEEKIVGFSAFVPDFNELNAVYVHSSYGNRGIGSKLLDRVETEAKSKGILKLQLHSSLTAERFYQKHEYTVDGYGVHTLRSGQKMECVLMSKRFGPAPFIEAVNEKNQGEAQAFLEHHKETSLFLLGNLEDHGPTLSEQLNSGNYRLIRRANSVVAVFSMTRRGNVLIQSDLKDDYSPEILKSISQDNISVGGIIGNWKDCCLLLNHYEALNPNFQVSFESKEILYSLNLANGSGGRNGAVRFLQSFDFEQWDRLNRDFMAEEGVPIQGDDESRRKSFQARANQKHLWGLFKNQELISIAAYNAKYRDLGQIGGVFTPTKLRRNGYSKACVTQLMNDSFAIHGLKTLILFTGEHNVAARALYESLGFRRIGYFGLIFGTT